MTANETVSVPQEEVLSIDKLNEKVAEAREKLVDSENGAVPINERVGSYLEAYANLMWGKYGDQKKAAKEYGRWVEEADTEKFFLVGGYRAAYADLEKASEETYLSNSLEGTNTRFVRPILKGALRTLEEEGKSIKELSVFIEQNL